MLGSDTCGQMYLYLELKKIGQISPPPGGLGLTHVEKVTTLTTACPATIYAWYLGSQDEEAPPPNIRLANTLVWLDLMRNHSI